MNIKEEIELVLDKYDHDLFIRERFELIEELSVLAERYKNRELSHLAAKVLYYRSKLDPKFLDDYDEFFGIRTLLHGKV